MRTIGNADLKYNPATPLPFTAATMHIMFELRFDSKLSGHNHPFFAYHSLRGGGCNKNEKCGQTKTKRDCNENLRRAGYQKFNFVEQVCTNTPSETCMSTLATHHQHPHIFAVTGGL